MYRPYLRGFGDTRFQDAGRLRSGQIGALGQDLSDFVKALDLRDVVIAGHDWGARAGYVVGALLPVGEPTQPRGRMALSPPSREHYQNLRCDGKNRHGVDFLVEERSGSSQDLSGGTMHKQNWLITGVSTGLGRAFAEAALAAGHTVVGTVRSEEDLRAFEELRPGNAHGRLLDVTDDDAVHGVVAEVEQNVGPLDVVVANAGYGLEGTFEETPLAEVRRQFEVNVFGAVATLQAALPHMRRRRRGHLMAVTSMGGLMAVPGMSAYCGSKFALEGILEALGKEVAQFGIHVTAIEPGSFRTDWAGRSMTRAARTVDDYDELFTPIREARQKASGNQLGNPAKAGDALVHITSVERPPAHLVLGSDALRLVTAARAAVDEDIRAWEALSRTTDFADGAQL